VKEIAMLRVTAVTMLGLTVAAAGAAQDADPWSRTAAVGLGPLLLRAQSPVAILRLSPTPEVPETLQAGRWEVESLTSWNNYFDADPGRYTIDAETVRLSTTVGYGVSDRWDVRVSVPVSYRGGGVLDRFIEGFEGVIGMSNPDRKLAPRNRFLVEIHGRDGRVFRRAGGDAGWGLEDSVLAARYQLAPGDASHPAILVAVGIKLPTGREASLYSSGGVDVGAGIFLGQRLSDHFHLYGSFALMRYATMEMAGVQLTSAQESLFAALEYRHSRRTSWLLQTVVTTPGAEHFGGFSKRTYEVSAGFKHVLRPDLLEEASVSENLFIFDNSPDVGVHLGLVWRSTPRTRWVRDGREGNPGVPEQHAGSVGDGGRAAGPGELRPGRIVQSGSADYRR
jgi:Protein of unknown function (DUF3187)